MRIGPWSITRQKRDALGRPLFPWEIVTLDQLSDEARQVITKMARVSARDFYEELREQWLEYLRSDLDARIESSVRKARARYWEDEGRAAAGGKYMDGTAKAMSREGRAAGLVVPVPPLYMALPDDTQGVEGTGCSICGIRWLPGTRMMADGAGGWSHRFGTDCIPGEGVCFVCERPFKAGEKWQALHTDPSQWMHLDEPECIVTPMKKKDTP